MTSTHAYRRRVLGPDHLNGPRDVPARDVPHEVDRLRRELEEGASFILTDGGVPIGRLTALNELRVSPAQSQSSWADFDLEPTNDGPSVMDILDELREDRL